MSVPVFSNVTGRGVRVAILDTGVDNTHPDLRGAVVAEHCFTSSDCPPLHTNEGTSAVDDNGHGTAVAGVIASRGMVAPRGFAPDAQIVAVKVQGADNHGVSTDWVAGLKWLYENQSTLNVDVVVMGFGTEMLFNSADCQQMLGPLSKAVDNLLRAGVPVIASSGNAGSDTLLPAPACNPGVLAVGASYDAAVGPQPAAGGTYATQLGAAYAACRDELTSATTMVCFSNSGPRLDLLAPGAPVVSCALQGQARESSGTSNAAAAVGGVTALLKQCSPDINPMQLKALLVRTATKSTESASRPSYPIVNAERAVLEACPNAMRAGGSAGGPAAGGGGQVGAVASAAVGGAGRPSDMAGVSAPPVVQVIAGKPAAAGVTAATSGTVALDAGATSVNAADQEDSGIGQRSFPLMPTPPVHGSLPPTPHEDSRGCSVATGPRGARAQAAAAWATVLSLCALGACRSRRRRA